MAFSTKLVCFGFDLHSMFVIDLLHKVKLGVWKATFTYLMQALQAAADNAIQKLNQ
ncbi:hypothetical protein HETIRDRAFT_174956 [Heterobasidion irregulare TC 32-1]|uniref:Uncharacterized protein n=1 Tax=Heterobasidion irregulare (strain TC 32-1) TaxID=747525 RepID=W4JV09_HETIT|nr:uncharacterized protein HETIRDRAFT_174956 [Heterobasidion irregulare TC 32-1]ETW76920.1 hypothetical protein HETIRDRAFT_174956 [Heterobasidion irregulare TC 32-1]